MLDRIDNNSNVNGNNNLNNNNGRLVGIAHSCRWDNLLMADNELYSKICSYENLELAFSKARQGKTLKPYIIEFEQHLKRNLQILQVELFFQTYQPRPLETFVLRDPKTRKISKSDFRDRVVHHAICNIIGPLFEKSFIFDSYANRKGKGTLKAIERFEHFAQIVSRGHTRHCYVLKADIRHYFETVDHSILFSILSQKIQDKQVLWLIQIILSNHQTEESGKGMPLGNLTSQ
ncbi:MAG: reverse transcriptase domain-containing protein, partial [Nanoarchaeota archaeon]|nr:reverse transcriptase domain-containing protein [Nanoarchaeota archaeon]